MGFIMILCPWQENGERMRSNQEPRSIQRKNGYGVRWEKFPVGWKTVRRTSAKTRWI